MKKTLSKYRNSVLFLACTVVVIIAYSVICYMSPSGSSDIERLTLNYPNTQYEGIKSLLLALMATFSTIVAVLITIETNNNRNLDYQEKKKKLMNRLSDVELHLNHFSAELDKFHNFSIIEASLYSDTYTYQDNSSIQTISINSDICQIDEIFRIRSQVIKLYQLINIEPITDELILSMHFMKKSDFIKVHKLLHDTIFIVNTEYAEYISKILIDNDIEINSHNFIMSHIIKIIDLYNKEQKINEETIEKFKKYLHAMYSHLIELQNKGKIKINFSIPDPNIIFSEIDSLETFALQNITFYNHESMFSYIVCVSILRTINDIMNDYRNDLSNEIKDLKIQIELL